MSSPMHNHMDADNCPVFAFKKISEAPAVPPGLFVAHFGGPKITDGVSSAADALIPVLQFGQKTYWPMEHTNGGLEFTLVVVNNYNQIIRQFLCKGAKHIFKITGDREKRRITFWGDSNRWLWNTWDTLELPSYKASVADAKFVAQSYGLFLSDSDAQELVKALPTFDLSICESGPRRSSQTLGLAATVGGIAGGVLGAAAGLILGPEAIVAGAAIGAATGAKIGSDSEPTPTEVSTAVPSDNAAERATHINRKWAVGPYVNGHVWDDIFRFGRFKRFRDLDEAAAIAPPGENNTVLGYYPKVMQTKKLESSIKINKYGGELFHCIWVVVKVPNEESFQIRVNPEELLLNAPDRVNHSQLSEGSRIAALIRNPDLQVYGAGGLLVANGKLVGIGSQSGHYFNSFLNTEKRMIQEAINGFTALGYDMSGVSSIEDYINNPPEL